MGELWAHQLAGLKFMRDRPAALLAWEPRCGKTRAIVEEIARVGFNRVLIVCPKTVNTVWLSELMERGGNALPLTMDLTAGTIEYRRKRLKDYLGKDRVVVVNYDVLDDLKTELLRWKPDYVAADEVHKIKQAGSARSRVLHCLGRVAAYRRGLSGTPDPQSLSDYYSEYKFLDTGIFGTNYGVFADHYLVRHPLYPSKVVGYRNLPELQSKVFSIAHRVKRSDCFDIPSCHEIERTFVLTDSQRKEYDRVRLEAYPSQLTKLLRLQQYTANLKADYVVEELDEIIENGQSSVVFTRFRQEQTLVVNALRASYKGVPVSELHGDSTPRERADIQAAFGGTRTGSGIAVVQIATGSLGISLRGADYAIFSSLDWSYESYKQAKDRIWDSERPKTIIYLLAEGTPDRLVLETVRSKQDVSEAFLEGKL